VIEKVDIDSKDKYYRTPLGQAIEDRHESIIKLLLAIKKIDIDSKNTYNKTLLSRATKNRHKGIIKLLLAIKRLISTRRIGIMVRRRYRGLLKTSKRILSSCCL
jgi:ankyrin repeat protein